MQHHSQRISKAAVMADDAAICKKIDALKQQARWHFSPSDFASSCGCVGNSDALFRL
jgi:hypothetical protein